MSESENTPKLRQVGTRPVRPDGVDKVTGRAAYGADEAFPDMLWGSVVRSPHAHARIRGIDASKALALPGVLAVMTAADLPDLEAARMEGGEAPADIKTLSDNVMARRKVLYHGHAVAAVAATSRESAREAARLVEVDYEPLQPVLSLEAAMAQGAPILHDNMRTKDAVPPATEPSNVASRCEMGHGDVDAGFADADVVIERTFETAAVHQGYIEPHACIARTAPDGKVTIFASSQGHFMIRSYTAALLEMEISSLRVIPAEIGGGFGGKTTVYLEPLAVVLSRKAGRPVKMVMDRDEVFRATGPTSGSRIRVKLGARRDGRLCAADALLEYEAGAYPGSPVMPGCMTIFAPYDIDNVRAVGFDVVLNKPKVAAYRAPGAPMAAFAVESVLDELAAELSMDPMDLRLANAAKKGTRASYGPRFREIGCIETMQAVKAHPHYNAPLEEGVGRGVSMGFWFNGGMQSTAGVNLNEDGTITVVSGSPDIGGSRASMALMAAEELGIDYERTQAVVADTDSLGYNDLTGGSRTTFATGMAVVEAAREVRQKVCERAAAIFEVDVEEVTFREGRVYVEDDPSRDPISMAEVAGKAARMGGPIAARASLTARGVGPGFGAHICDVRVDEETGKVDVLRYTAIQDAGRAIHPSYVEGQMQGGAAQGIGWALNEEYVFDEEGRMLNPSFLDYRIPVASDLPMIDTEIVEVPNPAHPYGVRGVGEVPIVPPLAAVANAIAAATGQRFRRLPISPIRVLETLDAAGR